MSSTNEYTARLEFFVSATSDEKGMDVAESVWRKYQNLRPGVLVKNYPGTWYPKLNSLCVSLSIRCRDAAEAGSINEELKRLFAEAAGRS